MTEALPLVLNPKRLARDEGVDTWYPYYAGFSSRFASAAIAEAELRPGSLVLDPWAGSGTTLCAAVEEGHRAVGIDLNPFAVVLSAAKLCPAPERLKAVEVARPLARRIATSSAPIDELEQWMPTSAARRVEGIATAIRREFDIPADWTAIPPGAAFLLFALVRAVSDLVPRTRVSNPTWSRPGANINISTRDISRDFVRIAEQYASVNPPRKDLADKSRVVLADARSLPIASRSVHLILGSPPYCTRIDYAVTTRLELAVLGCDAGAFATLRRALMGTTAIRSPRTDEIPEHWPRRLRRVLASVRDHPSHRSKGYYLRNLLQYFNDADESLAEIRRTLTARGQALLVLQSSYYKEHELDLAALFADIAREMGLSAEIMFRMPVRRVMTSLNSKSRRYLDTRSYTESLLRLRRH